MPKLATVLIGTCLTISFSASGHVTVPQCHDLFTHHPAILEYISLLHSIRAMPGGIEKQTLLRELASRRNGIARLISTEQLARLDRETQIRIDVESGANLTKAVSEAKRFDISKLREQPKSFQIEGLRGLHAHDMASRKPVRFLAPEEGVMWSEAEDVVVVRSFSQSIALEVPALKKIGSSLPPGILSRDGRRYANLTSGGRIRVTNLRKNSKSTLVYGEGSNYEFGAPGYFTGTEIEVVDSQSAKRMMFQLHAATVKVGREHKPEEPIYRGGEVTLEYGDDVLNVIDSVDSSRSIEIRPAPSEILVSPDTNILLLKKWTKNRIVSQIIDLKLMRKDAIFNGDFQHFSPDGKWVYQVENEGLNGINTHFFNWGTGAFSWIKSRVKVQFVGESNLVLVENEQVPGSHDIIDLTDRSAMPLKSFNAGFVGVSPSGRHILTWDRDKTELKLWTFE